MKCLAAGARQCQGRLLLSTSPETPCVGAPPAGMLCRSEEARSRGCGPAGGRGATVPSRKVSTEAGLAANPLPFRLAGAHLCFPPLAPDCRLWQRAFLPQTGVWHLTPVVQVTVARKTFPSLHLQRANKSEPSCLSFPFHLSPRKAIPGASSVKDLLSQYVFLQQLAPQV